MASPLQQPSVRRKLIYFALILLLFTVTLVVRHADFTVAGGTHIKGIRAQASDLELSESDLGEADLTGSTIRLTLTGSRGLVVTYLWYQADLKKTRHEWNELELLVKSIITLQPHFINPWLFQSWNLAYNVAAESDRVRDKYFYISRGIQLIADGERKNSNSSDLRSMCGFYYRDKFGVSDEANTLQCLFQLSCMEPAERDPQKFRRSGRQLDLDRFQTFCENHPQLVRRLREVLFRDTPDKVVDFLADNQKLPSRYEDPEPGAYESTATPAKLKPVDKQFPVLCPPYSPNSREPTPMDVVDDDFDSFAASRGWLAYALDPLPPPHPEAGPRILMDASKKYRLPRKGMMLILLRQQPAQSQTSHAERLEREGWYDEKWDVSDWFPGRSVALGRKPNYAREAWEHAHRMWLEHGLANGLHFSDPDQLKRLRERAKKFQETADVSSREVPELQPGDVDDETYQDFMAQALLQWYSMGRTLTNFPHFYHQSLVLSTPDPEKDLKKSTDALIARKRFFQAEQMAKKGEPSRAAKLYEEAFGMWKNVLVKYPDFRRDLEVQERTYEWKLNYLTQLENLRGTLVSKLLHVQDGLALATVPTSRIPLVMVARVRWEQRLPVPFVLPLEGDGPEGYPWIDPSTVQRIRQTRKLPGTPVNLARGSSAGMTGRPEEMMRQMGMGGPPGR